MARDTAKPPVHVIGSAHRPRTHHQVRSVSSEAVPSQHSSVYDAPPIPSDVSQGESSGADDVHGPDTDEVRSSETRRYTSPHSQTTCAGTRLFTITEQKSVPTLKTIPSNWTFQRGIVSLQKPSDQDSSLVLQSKKRKRRCFSVDETALQRLRRGNDGSNATTGSMNSFARSPERLASVISAAASIGPQYALHRPPERDPTPTGLLRWPGGTPCMIQQQQDVANDPDPKVNLSWRNILRRYLPVSSGRSRSYIPRATRPSRSTGLPHIPDFQGLHDRTYPGSHANSTGSSWRPPRSGHTTHRYADLETHPFAHAPKASPWRPGAIPLYRPRIPERRKNAALPLASEVAHTRPSDEKHRPNVTSPPQRALLYASGNAVPVSPPRVSSKTALRSATLPVRLRRQSSAQSRIEERGSDASRTSAVAVRGEEQTRYRQSGTPIYDEGKASLRSQDRRREQELMIIHPAHRDSHDERRGQEHPQLVNRVAHRESHRAVGNGALRFVTASLPRQLDQQECDATQYSAVLSRSENRTQISPEQTCVTKAPELCKHELAKKARRNSTPKLFTNHFVTSGIFDGSTASPSPNTTAIQDYGILGPSSAPAAIQSPPRHSVAIAPSRTSLSAAQTFATAPSGTTFVSNPGGSTFAISPSEHEHHHALHHAQTMESVHSTSTAPGRA